MKKQIPKIIKEIKEKRPNDIDYSFQKSVSFSQLSIYNSCPYKWKLMYKDKLKPFTSSVNTLFGTAIHETLQEYITKAYETSWAEANRMILSELFEEKLREQYQIAYESNNNTHFTSADELHEYYEDGIEIINYIKKNYNIYFGNRGWYLVGCEIPIVIPPIDQYPNLLFNGYLDLVLYYEPTDRIKIIDFKSSTSGWYDSNKKDPNKINQLLLYKKYFAEQYNFPIENIDIEFMILKRKLREDSEWVQKRIQLFSPSDGKPSINKAINNMNQFILECFDKNNNIKDREYPKQPSKLCEWCPFGPDYNKC